MTVTIPNKLTVLSFFIRKKNGMPPLLLISDKIQSSPSKHTVFFKKSEKETLNNTNNI